MEDGLEEVDNQDLVDFRAWLHRASLPDSCDVDVDEYAEWLKKWCVPESTENVDSTKIPLWELAWSTSAEVGWRHVSRATLLTLH